MADEIVVPAVSVEEAEKVIKAEKEKKMKECAEEINAVLEKHGFTISIASSLELKPKT
jgi:hypothetical protein